MSPRVAPCTFVPHVCVCHMCQGEPSIDGHVGKKMGLTRLHTLRNAQRPAKGRNKGQKGAKSLAERRGGSNPCLAHEKQGACIFPDHFCTGVDAGTGAASRRAPRRLKARARV